MSVSCTTQRHSSRPVLNAAPNTNDAASVSLKNSVKNPQRIVFRGGQSGDEGISLLCCLHYPSRGGAFVKNRVDRFDLVLDEPPEGWYESPISRFIIHGPAEQYTYLESAYGLKSFELNCRNSANFACQLRRERLRKYHDLAINGEVSLTAFLTFEFFRCDSCRKETTEIAVPLVLVFQPDHAATIGVDPVSGVDYSQFVAIADIEGTPKVAARLTEMLRKAGITAIIEGVGGYDVSVAPAHKARATELLREDAKAHDYYLGFPRE